MSELPSKESQSRVILNFLPIATGGGLQNALSFLNILSANLERKKTCFAVVRRNSPLETLCVNNEIEYLAVADNRMARMVFEMRCRSTFRRGEICFTLFGPPMLYSCGYLVNIVGCAYSNFFYPEIPFWSFLPSAKKLQKEIIDVLRQRLTAMADYWIFETEALRKRAIEICHFPQDRIGVVRMAPSRLVRPEYVQDERLEELKERLPQGFKILYLSVSHPNKRHHLLPSIAHALCKQGLGDVYFVTTMQPSHPYTREVIGKFEEIGLGNYIVNIGPVASDDVATVIDSCDSMCTFSLLESFSNNFVEAWQMAKPLIVTDADWAREACGEGALYVDPSDATATAQAILKLMLDLDIRKNILDLGKKQLKKYPNAEEKTEYYFEEIDKVKALGACPASERGKISWPRILPPRK